MKLWLAKQLRRVLVWLGEESHLDLYARTLGMVRLPAAPSGSPLDLVNAIEQTVERHTPAGMTWRVSWDLKDRITVELNTRVRAADLEALKQQREGAQR